MGKTLTTNEFIKKAVLKHGERYDYSLVDYKHGMSKIKIICLKHGQFEQTPSHHLCGSGCTKCSNNLITTKEFIEKAIVKHGNKYEYSKVNYKNVRTKVIITCLIHGDFEQLPCEHLKGSICIKCAHNKKALTKECFIKRANLIHNNKYNYNKVEYKNAHTKVIIVCPKHGSFLQEPQSHLSGCGCVQCFRFYSNISIQWINYLQISINKEIQNILSPNGEYKIPSTKFKADGYCKETNTIYEFHGDLWHGNPKLYNKNNINPVSKKTFGMLYNYTQEKKAKILELGYNYVEIWEHDWRKTIKAIIKIQRIWKKYFKKISN
jgi:hypothetical protein